MHSAAHYSLVAPAKINVALHVTARRDDGYHEIDSLFVPLEHGDRVELTVQPSAETAIECRCPGFPSLDGPKNLAARAATALLERARTTARVQIVIDKQIWTAAGLGGGSSDAAAVLRGLNRWLDQREPAEVRSSGPLAPVTLAELGLSLGADIPFFLQEPIGPMIAKGIGEQLEQVGGCPALPLVLLNPNRGVSTVDAYRGLGLAPGERHMPDRPSLPSSFGRSLERIVEVISNDLEPVASAICDSIPLMKRALMDQGAKASGMSGSGATVFGIFEQPADAAAAALNISDTMSFSVCSTTGMGT